MDNERNTGKVIAYFNKQHLRGDFPGGQINVRYQGEVVLDAAIGIARGAKSECPIVPMTAETQCPVYSCGKPLAAIAIAMLEEQGKIDINAPIAEIFPEYSKHGKKSISTYDVLTHQSGVVLMSPELSNQMAQWHNREFIQHLLINAEPKYPHGTLAYSPADFGWILSEIVIRIDGRSISKYFQEEIATPLNLPNLQFGLSGRSLDSLAYTYWYGKDTLMMSGMNIAKDFEKINNAADFFSCENPAFTLVTNASSLSAFYAFILNGGATSDGKQLISKNILDSYTERQLLKIDKTTNALLSVGKGFLTGSLLPSFYGWWNTSQCFGHAGLFSSLAFGDYKNGLSVAIITNGNRGVGDFMKRFIPLSHKIRSM